MATEVVTKIIKIDVKGSKEAIKDLRSLQKHAATTDKNMPVKSR